MILRKDKNDFLTSDEMDNNFSELSERVTIIGDQSISGIKTFIQNPILTPNPFGNNLVTLSNFDLLGNKESVNFSEENPIVTSNILGKDYWFNLKTQEIYEWLGTEWNILNNPIKISGRYVLTKNNDLYFYDFYSKIFSKIMTEVINIFDNESMVFLIKSDGTLWAKGSNGNGQLGLNSTIDVSSFTLIPVTGVIDVILSSNSVFLIKSDGTVWACGSNIQHELGFGDNIERHIFEQIPGLTNIRKISSGISFTIIEKSDGTVWACGNNSYGQLGFPDTIPRTNLTLVPGLLNPGNIVCFGYTTLIEQDSELLMCGANFYGVFGSRSSDYNPHYLYDYVVESSFNNPNKIIPGTWFTIIEKSDGTFWVSGDFEGTSYYIFTELINPPSIKNLTTLNSSVMLIEDLDGFVYASLNAYKSNELSKKIIQLK